MKGEVTWLDEEQRVLHVRFAEGWTWDDFDMLTAQAYVLARTVPHAVNAVIDLCSAPRMPDAHLFDHIRKVTNSRPPNYEGTGVVGLSYFQQRFVNSLMSLFPLRKHTFTMQPTIDDAVRVLLASKSENYFTANF